VTLRTRLAIASAIVIALTIALLSAFVIRTTRATLIDQLDQQLVDASERSMKYPPKAGKPDHAPEDAAADKNQFAVQVFDRDGALIASVASGYGDDPDPLPDVPLGPDAGDDPALPIGKIVTVDAVDGSMRYRVYLRENRDGQLIATAAPLTEVESALARILRFTLGAGVIALSLAGLSSWLLIRNRLKPVDRMIDTAADIAAGDLSRRAPDADPRTELGRLSTALNEMLGQIEESVEAKVESERRLRRFVADAAHELRTPLTSLRGYAELHRAGALDSDEALGNAMRRIESESGRMQRLVDDLLLLARLDEQRGDEQVPVDLVPLLGEAIDAARAIEPDRPFTMQLPAAAVVRGDPVRLRQIFDNLLTNARIHTPAGTPVSVAGSVDTRDVTVTVADRGPGIAPEDQAHVFERFWRSDPSRTRSTGGTGLGLAIVASLVRALDGSVSLTSEPDQGASFTVRLPRFNDAIGAPGQATQHPERHAEAGRIRRKPGDSTPTPRPSTG
jgi:two-component system OmpR family sensor kinase